MGARPQAAPCPALPGPSPSSPRPLAPLSLAPLLPLLAPLSCGKGGKRSSSARHWLTSANLRALFLGTL